MEKNLTHSLSKKLESMEDIVQRVLCKKKLKKQKHRGTLKVSMNGQLIKKWRYFWFNIGSMEKN